MKRFFLTLVRVTTNQRWSFTLLLQPPPNPLGRSWCHQVICARHIVLSNQIACDNPPGLL